MPPTSRPVRLKRRIEFQNAAKGKRFHAKAFTLQSAPSLLPLGHAPGAEAGAPSPPRFGLTVTKKIGGAAARNRIRRRLREALRGLDPLPARPGHDYVVVAKGEALTAPYEALRAELARAFGAIDAARPKKPRRGPAEDQRR